MKYVELKMTEYQIFEVDDSVTYEDIDQMYYEGTLLMDSPHTAYLDAQIVNNKCELDGSYINIL